MIRVSYSYKRGDCIRENEVWYEVREVKYVLIQQSTAIEWNQSKESSSGEFRACRIIFFIIVNLVILSIY